MPLMLAEESASRADSHPVLDTDNFKLAIMLFTLILNSWLFFYLCLSLCLRSMLLLLHRLFFLFSGRDLLLQLSDF